MAPIFQTLAFRCVKLGLSQHVWGLSETDFSLRSPYSPTHTFVTKLTIQHLRSALMGPRLRFFA